MRAKQKVSLIFNILIFLLAFVGSIFCFGEIYLSPTTSIEHGIKLFKFFTVQSNVFAGITSLVYIIFYFREKKTKKQIPFFVTILRYIATIDLVITFLVVALFLGFVTEDGYFSLYLNANFLFHFLIPVLNFISFAFFENSKLKFRHTFLGLTHLLLYSAFYLAIVLTHFKNGKVPLEYDWYAFAQFGFIIMAVSAAIVLFMGYFTAYVIYIINNRHKK